MIQKFLSEKVKALVSDMLVTYDFKPREDNTITVYFEGGTDPNEYDLPIRHPRYMVYLSSSDWDYVESLSNQVFDLLSNLDSQMVDVDFLGRGGETLYTKLYKIQSISPQGDLIPLGISNNIRNFSMNFEVTLIEAK